MRVMVLGGTGFVGRHAAAALRARGHTVVIGTRDPKRALRKLPPALRASLHDVELREIHFESLTTRYVWKPLLADVDAVVNAAGILRERGGETYDRVHNMAPSALALACERLGLRLVHVSMLGLRREARSRFLRSKLLAERAIAATAADYCIVRPSLLDGEGGFGADWMRRVARMPVHFFPANAAGRIAALDARDLGEAIATLCEVPGDSVPRQVELGGSARRTLADYLRALRAARDERPALQIPVPAPLVRLAGALCDLFHLTPVSGGLLELVRRDNLPAQNLLQALIGRAPTPVGQDLPARRRSYAFAAMPTGHETPVPPSPQ
ncbi:MAG TPA: NAD(P)H-binding protein [Burkholderiales bacterium]|nr:NAD(P)H-binding protein [Burkholderiales bacterium]